MRPPPPAAAAQNSMARRNRKMQATRIWLNGKRADNAYGLSELVGEFVGRQGMARKRAGAGLARRAAPVASRAIREKFNVKPRQLSGKITAKDTGDALRIYAWTRRIPLTEFSGKWGGHSTPGATAMVVLGQIDTFKGSFITTIQGRRAIRIRVRKGGRRVGRGPVRMLYGPSPRDMIVGHQVDQERNVIGSYGNAVENTIVTELVTFYIAEYARLVGLEK